LQSLELLCWYRNNSTSPLNFVDPGFSGVTEWLDEMPLNKVGGVKLRKISSIDSYRVDYLPGGAIPELIKEN
jgi:hypothetical protein